eukprot:6673091-Prymnesium_polylepis.1
MAHVHPEMAHVHPEMAHAHPNTAHAHPNTARALPNMAARPSSKGTCQNSSGRRLRWPVLPGPSLGLSS